MAKFHGPRGRGAARGVGRGGARGGVPAGGRGSGRGGGRGGSSLRGGARGGASTSFDANMASQAKKASTSTPRGKTVALPDPQVTQQFPIAVRCIFGQSWQRAWRAPLADWVRSFPAPMRAGLAGCDGRRSPCFLPHAGSIAGPRHGGCSD